MGTTTLGSGFALSTKRVIYNSVDENIGNILLPTALNRETPKTIGQSVPA